jgi:hypothetical protein
MYLHLSRYKKLCTVINQVLGDPFLSTLDMGVFETGTSLSKSAYVSMTTVIAFCNHGRLEKRASEFGCKDAATC